MQRTTRILSVCLGALAAMAQTPSDTLVCRGMQLRDHDEPGSRRSIHPGKRQDQKRYRRAGRERTSFLGNAHRDARAIMARER